jgi:hypothetical protein
VNDGLTPLTHAELMETLRALGPEAAYDALFPAWAGRLRLMPQHMRAGMARWIVFGIRPGGFLTAVLHNDLFGALKQADDINMRSLPEIGMFLYNYAPSLCYGSQSKVSDWTGCAPKPEVVQPLDDELDTIGKED